MSSNIRPTKTSPLDKPAAPAYRGANH
jgi:hypothetical protein